MTKRPNLKLMGKKVGMITYRIPDDRPNAGKLIAVTVIKFEENKVTQVKRLSDAKSKNEGYEALQIATGECSAKNIAKPRLGILKKVGIETGRRHLFETRVDNIADYQEGHVFDVSAFKDCVKVDVTGTSKGKGYAGVMKKYNFAGGPASHGCSVSHRREGSSGMRSSPGRCLPGMPKPSHMGDKQVTTQSVRVELIDEARGLMLVRGAVPGSANHYVVVQKAIKG